MATEVKIPALGESIASGILAKWHVKDGDFVKSGDSLYDLETDKITSEGTAELDGVIRIQAAEGDEVEIGAVIALIDAQATPPPPAAKEASKTSAPVSVPSADTGQSGPQQASFRQPPSVSRLSEEHGIDPTQIAGSGKGGRVTKGDMLAEISKRLEHAASPATSEPPLPANSDTPARADTRSSRKKMTPLRKTIAARLVEAQHTTAMLTTFNEVDMSAVMAARKSHQEAFVQAHGTKLGFMSFFVKAVVRALQAWPSVNARIEGDEIISHHYFDIGVAVSTPKGLMVPVIRDCDQLSFAGIEKAIIATAGRAREGKIGIDDLKGGVFTITNGGIFGSMLSTPILNTPQSAILGMHTIQDRAVVFDGEIKIRPMMYVALSYDHRIIDGREAVGFLCAVKNCIEEPARILLEI
jgi:2-oxoglutarate dehydrogenase E2 component (dihydrolipoamide succinyltransferase)